MISSGKNEIKEEKKVDKGIARLRNVPAVMFYLCLYTSKTADKRQKTQLASFAEWTKSPWGVELSIQLALSISSKRFAGWTQDCTFGHRVLFTILCILSLWTSSLSQILIISILSNIIYKSSPLLLSISSSETSPSLLLLYHYLLLVVVFGLLSSLVSLLLKSVL